MADKRKKHHQPTEDNQEGDGEKGDDVRSVVELLLENQNKKDEEDRTYRARAEEREERRLIAAEERAEARLIAARIAEEERIEARAEAKAKRREEAALRAEELNRAREEADRQAAARMRKQQEAAEQRAYDQQVVLIRMQAQIGEKVAEAHRQEGQRTRKRDRAIAGICNYREPEDLEDFLLTSERKLRVGEVPEGEWLAVMAAKLSGKVGTTWQELCGTTDEYQQVKNGVLKASGYTPKLAGEAFFGFKAESLKGLAADQVYNRGAQLLRRMVAPEKLSARAEFSILKPWIWSIVGRRCRLVLDARAVSSSEELLGALQDYLVSDGERVEGRAAVFRGEGQFGSGFKKHNPVLEGEADRKKGNGSGSGSGSSITCFKCGKTGHKAADCWQGGGGPSNGSKAVSGSVAKVVTCYTCGVEGHKSTTCPKKDVQKESVPKSVRQLWVRDSKDTIIEGMVNGTKASLLLDSGAHISIVPEGMVGEELKTRESVLVRPFQSKTPIRLPTAKIRFCVEGLEEWEELVALASVEVGKESEVLYGLDLRSARGLDLVILVNRLKQSEVNRVTTRAEGRKEAKQAAETAKVVEREKPQVRAVAREVAKPVGKLGPGEGGAAEDRPAGLPKPVSCELDLTGSEKSTGEGGLAADRPVSNLEPVSQEETIGEELPDLALAEETVDLPEEIEFCLRESREGLEDLEFPPMGMSSDSRVELVREVHEDPSLESWRLLAEKGEQGFSWDRGLLYQARTSHTSEVIHLMVLLKKARSRVLKMAHEGSGHLGARKVKALLKQRFVWPGMGVDVIAHTRSCEVCQRCAKAKGRRVPLMERQVLTEPFEVMAFDLVGPFPKGKGGCEYVLTAVCMSSRWPEAVPLKSITARAVATGMIEIFSRTGIPLQLLTDQGSQFLSSLVTHLCRDLGVDKLRTAPYHPECNGVVERMHGTLDPMLTKASQRGLDWVGQLPFALFALRSAPNKDSSISPYQLVYGHRVRTPLDILHQGWAELAFEELDTEEWSDWLVERLEVWHDVQRERNKDASEKRKGYYDRGTVDRQLEIGDQVLCR